MNGFSRLCNSSWPNPSYDYQMNGKDIRLGYTNLRGILDGKRTIRYKSISDILILMFLGINKCSQGWNIFVIDFGSPQYQKIRNFINLHICRISHLQRAMAMIGSSGNPMSINDPELE